MAGSAIGILIANGFVTAAMAKAADEYARLRAVSFGIARPAVAYDLAEPRSPRLRSEGRLVELRAFFEGMVGRISWDQKRQIDQLLVDGAPAGLVRPDPPRARTPAGRRGRAHGAAGRAGGVGQAIGREPASAGRRREGEGEAGKGECSGGRNLRRVFALAKVDAGAIGEHHASGRRADASSDPQGPAS